MYTDIFLDNTNIGRFLYRIIFIVCENLFIEKGFNLIFFSVIFSINTNFEVSYVKIGNLRLDYIYMRLNKQNLKSRLPSVCDAELCEK